MCTTCGCGEGNLYIEGDEHNPHSAFRSAPFAPAARPKMKITGIKAPEFTPTRELQRWRLILGEAAETTLCGLDDNARQIDHALEWLYGRDPERLQRGERSGGLGGSNLTTPEWINSIHTLFPQQVIERLESDAVLRYGIEDVVTNLDVLERMQPSESLLRAVLHTKHLMKSAG